MNTIRIAIADDHPLVRAGIISLIQSFPQFDIVAEADNGQQLLDQLNRLNQLPDICTIDVGMPVMDGYDTVAAIKANFPSIKCLAISVFDHEYSVVRMLLNGARGYLLKSSPVKYYVNAIEAIYNTGYYFSDTSFKEIAAKAAQSPYRLLTAKEIEFVGYCCSELSYKEIAARMFISQHTIYDYQKSIATKLGIRNRAAIVFFAMSTGLVKSGHERHTNQNIKKC